METLTQDSGTHHPARGFHGEHLRWRIEYLASFVVIICIGVLLVWGLLMQRNVVLAETERELSSLSRLAEARISNQIENVDRVLNTLSLQYEMGALPTPNAPPGFWFALIQRLPDAVSLSATDSRGRIIAASDPAFIGQDLGDSAVFRAVAAETGSAALHVSPVTTVPRIGEVVSFAKRVLDDDGGLKGVILVSIPCAFYEHMLSNFRTSPTRSVALMRLSNDYLARSPALPSYGAIKLPDGETLLAKHAASGLTNSIQRFTSHEDRVEKIGAAALVTVDPSSTRPQLVVALSERMDVALRPWYRLTHIMWGYAAMLAVALWLARSNYLRMRDNEHYIDLIEALMSNPDVLVVGIDEQGTVSLFNEAAAKLSGYARTEVVGKNWFDLQLSPAEQPAAHSYFRQLLNGDRVPPTHEGKLLARDGAQHVVIWHNTIIRKNGYLQSVSFGRDITAQRAREAELAEQAQVDPLTGVANRRHLLDLGEHYLRQARLGDSTLAVLMLDIDHFKKINDSYGHHAGDVVLQNFASVCGQTLRQTDSLGRIGGEEFAVFLPCSDADVALHIAERIRVAVSEAHTTIEGAGTIDCTVSIGVAILEDGDETCDTLLQRADNALYAAKKEGRNRVFLMSGQALLAPVLTKLAPDLFVS